MTETTEYIEKKQSKTSLFTPNFEPIEYGTPVSSDIVAKLEPVFEIEKQYSFDTSSYEKNKEQESVMEMPTFERKQEAQIVAKEQSKTVSHARMGSRAKIMISCYSIIVAILLALTIYSSVMISSYSADIASKTQIVATQTSVINALENTYNVLGENETIASSVSDSFKTPNEDNVNYVGGFEFQERTKDEVESNWFEDFCAKIKKIFS